MRKASVPTYRQAVAFYDRDLKSIDAKSAFELMYGKAIEGNGPAACRVGYSFDNGIGTKRSAEKAYFWYLKAAKAGIAVAQYNLYLLLRDGIGVERNLRQAVRWLKSAAELGDGEAICDLGYCRFNGIGMKRDIEGGIREYKRAARKKVPRAFFNLGWVLSGDSDVEAEMPKALKYLERAAELGHARAAIELSRLYSGKESHLVPRDVTLQKKFASLAKELAE